VGRSAAYCRDDGRGLGNRPQALGEIHKRIFAFGERPPRWGVTV
jgi:hypothetical protein